jgi:hypothetical protein
MLTRGEVIANMGFGEGGHAAYFTVSTSIYRLKLAHPGRCR